MARLGDGGAEGSLLQKARRRRLAQLWAESSGLTEGAVQALTQFTVSGRDTLSLPR